LQQSPKFKRNPNVISNQSHSRPKQRKTQSNQNVLQQNHRRTPLSVASFNSLHRVRKLICPLATLARAITNFPPTAVALTGAGRPAPSINQNIPRIAHTDISTARITDVRKISATAAPAIKVSICPSHPTCNAKQKCTSRTNPKTSIYKGI
jgi:hypothetical protein